MKLDVIIATYNRSGLLERLLASLRAAPVPPSLTANAVVVDNNSRDATKAMVERAQKGWNGRLRYLFEPRQGKCYALNRGIESSDAGLIGLLDDDEEIDNGWFETIARTFADSSITFISGPYVPRWGGPIPSWLPATHPAIIGWVDAGTKVLEYEKDYFGTMMGGNAVVRAGALKRIGGFNTGLGRTGDNLCGCEDADVYRRLMLNGARGLYVPDLVIHHYVPPERLTKQYYRRWCLHHAVTLARVDQARPQPVPYLLGVPRYLVGRALRAVPRLIAAAATRRWATASTFGSELALWDLAGFVYGRYLGEPSDLATSGGPSRTASGRARHPLVAQAAEKLEDACRTN